ncbi:MAG: 5-carboxymethyl-2-hydroxymuconate isomerase, partial [Bradyrhizobium sp.]|nr:5-carboxymethyl-2-hydroxymuconate isomerase [Bradyrhizobium sp.]
ERFDMTELMRALHAAAASTGVVQAPDIKIRAISYDDYLVAGIRDGFCMSPSFYWRDVPQSKS